MTTKRPRAAQPRKKRAGKLPLVSQAEYARHRGVSREAVRRAIAAGRIKPERDGRIDPEKADLAWRENTVPRAPTQPAPERQEPTAPDGSPDDPGYFGARAKREHFLAQLAELTFGERSGKLVEADKVDDVAFTAARTARDKILGVRARLAGMISPEAADKLDFELQQVCDELAGDVLEAEKEQAS